MLKQLLLTCSASTLLLSACTNIESPQYCPDDQEVSTENLVTVHQKNDLIENYAKILSSSLGNPELRKAIKTEALLKFDGDNDILVSKLHSMTLASSNRNIESIIRSSAVTTKSNGYLGSITDAIHEQFPNLQVAVPVHCDEWDTENYTPLVAYLPFDYNEDEATHIKAFDQQGNEYLLSTEEEPNVPVIVVSISERVDENGNLIYTSPIYDTLAPNTITPFSISETDTKAMSAGIPRNLSLMHGTQRSFELSWDDVSNETGYEIYRRSNSQTSYNKIASLPANQNYYIDKNLSAGVKYSYRLRSVQNGQYSAYTPNITSFASARNDGASLKVTGLYFTTNGLKAVEKWPSGAPEIRLRIIVGNESNAWNIYTSGVMEPATRNSIKDKWWNHTINLPSWYIDEYGTVLTFDWREEDWNQNVEFSISANFEIKIGEWGIGIGASWKSSANKGGHHIGTSTVCFWDTSNKIYDVSGFKWKVQ